MMMMNMLKYGLEGLAVAVAAYYIPKKVVRIQEILMIALTAALTFMLLDVLAPEVGAAARNGAGFGIGAQTVGYKGPGVMMEGMEGGKISCNKKEKKESKEGLSDKMHY